MFNCVRPLAVLLSPLKPPRYPFWLTSIFELASMLTAPLTCRSSLLVVDDVDTACVNTELAVSVRLLNITGVVPDTDSVLPLSDSVMPEGKLHGPFNVTIAPVIA